MSPFLLSFCISLISLILLLINGILYFKKRKNKDQVYKIITLYLTCLFGIELICNIMGFLKPGSNLFLSHFYFNAQFALLSIFFYYLFDSKKLKKSIAFTYFSIVTIIILQYLLNTNLFWQFNLFEIVATSFILISYALIYIYKTLGESTKYYYLLFGLMLYLLCSSIIFLSGNLELVFIKDPYIDIWIFNSLFYIVYQVLINKEWQLLNKNIDA